MLGVGDPLTRSPLLLDPAISSLLVVDVQSKLLPLIARSATVVSNTRFLVDVANLLSIPIACTEQYPQGLGPTVPEIADRLGEPPREKCMFSCRECVEIFERLHQQGRRQIVIVGIETHVCVMQSTLDLLSMGFDCYVAQDATGSRHVRDRDSALNRMEISGALLTTTEAIAFEWCEDSRHPHFRQVSSWVKERDARKQELGMGERT